MTMIAKEGGYRLIRNVPRTKRDAKSVRAGRASRAEPSDLQQALRLAEATAARFSPPQWDLELGDVFSAAYPGAIQGHRRYDPSRGPYRTFIITYCRAAIAELFRSNDHLSRHQRQKANANPEDRRYWRAMPVFDWDPDGDEAPPELLRALTIPDDLERILLSVDAGRWLCALSGSDRFIIERFYFDDWQFSRIAAALGLNTKYTAQRCRNVLKKLREAVGSEDGL